MNIFTSIKASTIRDRIRRRGWSSKFGNRARREEVMMV
jgi:hypothetical protein